MERAGNRKLAALLEYSTGAALLSAMLVPLGILGWQSYRWLRFGEWPPLSGRLLVGELHFDWVGVQRVADWALNLPLFLWAAAALYLVYIALSGAAGQERDAVLRDEAIKRRIEAADTE